MKLLAYLALALLLGMLRRQMTCGWKMGLFGKYCRGASGGGKASPLLTLVQSFILTGRRAGLRRRTPRATAVLVDEFDSGLFKGAPYDVQCRTSRAARFRFK